jgi:hypothetical protein
MYEPDVTLTDYLIAVECLAIAGLLINARLANVAARRALIGLFASLGLAGVLGGTSHGFFPEGEGFASSVIWAGTLLAIGTAAWSGWAVFAWTSFEPGPARVISGAAGLIFCLYAFYIVAIDQAYLVAILHYAPASLALLVVFFIRAVQSRALLAWTGFCGVLLTFVAAGVQQAGLALHPLYFNHNAAYHMIQFIALFLFYKGARWSCDQPILFSKPAALPAI